MGLLVDCQSLGKTVSIPVARSWANPIIEENFTYSGHLLVRDALMTIGMRSQSPSIFHWNFLLWGKGNETLHYDDWSVRAAMLAEMERDKVTQRH